MNRRIWPGALAVVFLALLGASALADSVETINANTDRALRALKQHAFGADELLQSAAGVLVFPDIFKLGFGVGGQYGEGVLLVKGQPVAYYTTAGKTFGLASDARFKSEVIVFRTAEALQQFRDKRGWQVGRDGSVSLARPTAGGGLAFGAGEDPVVGFILSDQGLAADLTMDGARITRMAR